MPTWIDFKELRAKLKFESLLRFYQIEVRRKGAQHQGPCPLPNHRGKHGPPPFSVNLERDIFHCFGCGAKGNALDFALLMEKVNPDDGRAVRKVALKLRRELLSDVMPVNSRHPRSAPALGRESRTPVEKRDPPAPNVIVNAPLDFELKELETDNLRLLEDGLTAGTVAHFGLGFCSRGMLKGRVAIPLHDHDGKLVGYAGRVVDYGTVSGSNPEYLFPTTRERNGTVYEFRKSLFLYNGSRIDAPCDNLVVVGGLPSVWWLHQNGCPHTVAVLDSECSARQADLITSLVKPSGRVWILPSGNKDGEHLARSTLLQVSPHRFVRWVKLNLDWQPTDLTAEQIKTRFNL